MSLMRRHQKVVFQQQLKQADRNHSSELRKAEYRKWLVQLHKDQGEIKRLTDHDERNRLAAKKLEAYLTYLRDWLSSGANHQNDVLTQCVIWAIDGECWDVLFELADPAIANPRVGKLHWMKRELADFVTSEIIKIADTEQKAGTEIKAPVWPVLERIQDGRYGEGVNHVCKARYHKFCGLLAMAEKDWLKAVALLSAADELYPNIGVKGKLAEAQKMLESTVDPVDSVTEIGEVAENDSPTDQHPPAEQPEAQA